MARITVKELRAEARELGIRGYSLMKKAELEDAVRKAEAKYVVEEAPLRKLTLKELRAEAREFEVIGSEIYRGIADIEDQYFEKIINLKVGDIFDLEMPSSFTSEKQVAKDFAGMQGIIFHIMDTDLLNAPSISGMSFKHEEKEILVSDYLWEVVKIDDQRMNFRGDDMYHITLKRKR